LKDSMSVDLCTPGAREAAGVTCSQAKTSQLGIARSAWKQEAFLRVSPQGAGRVATGFGVPISFLVNMVQRDLAGPVVIDKTRITGTYDFRIEYASTSASVQQDDTPYPSLSSALEREFGLKLEPTKTSVNMLVIDHIDPRPTEN